MASQIFIGNTEIIKVYQGNQVVWEKATKVPKQLVERITKIRFEGKSALLVEFGQPIHSNDKLYATYRGFIARTERIIFGGNKQDKTRYTVAHRNQMIATRTEITVPSPSSRDKEPYQFMIITMNNPVAGNLEIFDSKF